MDIEDLEETEAQSKLLKALHEFEHYINANKSFIPNYGDRYRNGENIATGFVESTVNQVISKRFVKKQQMRWTERGRAPQWLGRQCEDGAQYYKADEIFALFDLLAMVVKAKDTTTVGKLRPLIEHYEDVRFSRVLVNKQLKESFNS